MKFSALAFVLAANSAFANPHWDTRRVPQASDFVLRGPARMRGSAPRNSVRGLPSLRLLVGWSEGERYELRKVVRENSGTEALARRARLTPPMGSYVAKLLDPRTNRVLLTDSIGTGKEFRRLVRDLTFRFPDPGIAHLAYEIWAEHPDTGVSQRVLNGILPAPEAADESARIETRLLRAASKAPKLLVNVYSEGYLAATREKFFSDSQRVVRAFEEAAFPGQEHFEFRAVYEASPITLGSARNLGTPIPEYGTNLGLYFPYWNGFGRWYHVVYPTREEKYRRKIALEPYDYPIALVNDRAYWGVGNFREHTAIPADNSAFTYLLLHEFGHYMGLNEEYEGGGRTELEFAPGLHEPWSPNITFLRDPSRLKWQEFVTSGTPVPTPAGRWSRTGNPVWGAYRGGYADSPVHGAHSHKPGYSCIMESGPKFCVVCTKALTDLVAFDLGAPNAQARLRPRR